MSNSFDKKIEEIFQKESKTKTKKKNSKLKEKRLKNKKKIPK
jgi:hypothetical protein